MKTRALTACVLAASLLVQSGCTRSEPAATLPSVSTTEPAPTTVAQETTTTPHTTAAPVVDSEITLPLTGVGVAEADDIPQRPALAVKIPMNEEAMPQAGVNRADIVFQTIINDSFTRLLAVFQSRDSEPLGPIRSARDQDIDLIDAFNVPLFAWSGANPGVTKLVRRAAKDGQLVDLDHDRHGDLYYRRENRNGAPHNLFSSTATLWAQTPDEFNVPNAVFEYSGSGDDLGGDPAEQINVVLDSIRSSWEYDPETQRYVKWNNSKPHMTENDGQVWADNVVVMVMDYGVSSIDPKNPQMDSVGAGLAYVFRRGTVSAGYWVRPEATDGWVFVDGPDTLNHIDLVPGRTWVEMPRDRDGVLSYQSDGNTVEPVTGGQEIPEFPETLSASES